MEYPFKELADAMYDIMTVEFHDVLPGSSIQPAEEMGIRMMDHAIEILTRLKAKAFFALASGQKKADPDKIPLCVYNPYPYEITENIICEFNLWDQDRNPYFMKPIVYDKDGKIIPSQCEKEYSTIPINWRKRVVFRATLAPMALNRFDCGFETMDEINENMPLEINPKPDTIIRVLMEFKGLDKPIYVKEQKLTSPNRYGFTVVEWGGTELN